MAGDTPSLVVKVAANLDELRAAMQQAQATVGQLADNVRGYGETGADAFDKVGRAAEGAKREAGFLSDVQRDLVGLFAVDKIVAFGQSVLDMGDHLVKVSDQTGLTIEQVQQLEYVAGQSGSSMESLTSAVQTLEQRLGSSDSGTIKAIEDLGLRMETFTQLNPYEQMLAIADAIAKIEDPTLQAAAAADVFGKNWKEILPAIKSGMREVAEQASTMSAETAKRLDELGDRMTALNTRLKVWAAGAVDFLDKAGEAVGNWASSWVNAGGLTNKELLAITEKMAGVVDVTDQMKAATKGATDATGANTAATSTNTGAKTDNAGATTKQTDAEKERKRILEDMDRTTFQLAMQHEKQWREETEKTMNARNAAVVKALDQTKAAEADLADYIAKTALSTTDYQIKKINDWVDAQLAAYDQSMGDYDRYSAAIVGKAELQKQALVQKAQETQAAIADVIMPDTPIGHGPDTPTAWSSLVPKPIGVRPIGGTINTANATEFNTDPLVYAFLQQGYTVNEALAMVRGVYNPTGQNIRMFAGGGAIGSGEPAIVGERGPEMFVPSVPGVIVPNSGAAPSITNHIYVTQPLGTPQAIAAAVGAAQMTSLRTRGERFRPTGV